MKYFWFLPWLHGDIYQFWLTFRGVIREKWTLSKYHTLESKKSSLSWWPLLGIVHAQESDNFPGIITLESVCFTGFDNRKVVTFRVSKYHTQESFLCCKKCIQILFETCIMENNISYKNSTMSIRYYPRRERKKNSAYIIPRKVYQNLRISPRNCVQNWKYFMGPMP